MKIHCLVVGLLLLSGCASAGPDACARTDWYQQGYADGRNTWYSRIEEHTARCAAAGVKPDAKRYQEGWDEGQTAQKRPAGG